MSERSQRDSLSALLRVWGRPAATMLVCVWLLLASAQSATVERKVYVSFDGTLTGASGYSLGPGELDVTGTFRKNGSATISNGVADIPGDLDSTSGFWFNSAALGALTTQNWVTEAVLVPDTTAADQPGLFNHFLDIEGDLFFRYNGNTAASKFTQFGYWDGSSEPTITTPDLLTNRYSHVALTWNAGSHVLEGFVDGVSQGTISTGNVFATPSSNVGYGFFARTGFFNRAINGKLASVAFSTYTGSFSPGFGAGFDFQLDPNDTTDLALKLEINTISGAAAIVNNTLAPISIQGYDVTSLDGALDVTETGWWSLSSQNLNPVLGGDELGETWQEGANPSAETFLEAFLLGSTTIAPGESLSLGKAYDAALDSRDLRFRYRMAGQSGTVTGIVAYDDATPQIFGDFDDDLDVDGQDFLVWQRAVGTSTILPNDRTPGTVTSSDLLDWQAHYGSSLNPSQLTAKLIPEFSTGMCWWVGLIMGEHFSRRQRILTR